MSRTPSREESVRSDKERIPVSSQRAPLRYKGLDTKNFVQRWVLDKDDRLQVFQDAGYEFVKPTVQGTSVGDPTVDSSKGLDTRVHKTAGFGNLRLYLMQIPRKWYEEDQAKKQLEVDASEESMKAPGKGKAISKDIDYGKITLDRSTKDPTALD